MSKLSRADVAVLVVEDNAETREVFAFSLRAMGYQVSEAENGRNALDCVRLATPDVILTDLRMPEMSGIELAVALQEFPQYASIPVVLVTATPLREKSPARQHFSALMTKPVTLDELTSTIDKAAGVGC